MKRINKIIGKMKRAWRMKYYSVSFDPKYVPEWEVKKGLQKLKEEIEEKYLPKEEGDEEWLRKLIISNSQD